MDFTDVIKYLEIGRLFQIIWVGTKCNHRSPNRMRMEGDLT